MYFINSMKQISIKPQSLSYYHHNEMLLVFSLGFLLKIPNPTKFLDSTVGQKSGVSVHGKMMHNGS